jgi:hypothetical protein
MKKLLVTLAASLGLSSGAAVAGPISSDLTTNDYITIGSLDWAWASPVTSGVWFGSNELFQASFHAGWREATDAEWAARPDATAFGTQDKFKCASQYWNSNFTHCDYTDGTGGYLSQHWVASPENTLDLWYVRDVASSVPEPGTLALIGIAIAGLSTIRRRQKTDA